MDSPPIISPAPTHPTPRFPGHFSTTPAPYDQQEGPLEAAGRELPSTDAPQGSILTSSGSLFLGAAAGLAVGGLAGAFTGAGLLGLTVLESDALAQRNANSPSGNVTPTEATEATFVPTTEDTTSATQEPSTVDKALFGVTGLAAGGLAAAALDDKLASNSSPIHPDGLTEPTPSLKSAPSAAKPLTETTPIASKLDESLVAEQAIRSTTLEKHGPFGSTTDELAAELTGEGVSTADIIQHDNVATAAALVARNEQTLHHHPAPSTTDEVAAELAAEGIPLSAILKHDNVAADAAAHGSRFHEEINRPFPVSRFSDSTYAESVSSIDDSRPSAIGPADTYEAQRVTIFNLGDEPTGAAAARKITPEELVVPAFDAGLVGFPAFVAGQEPTTAQKDFAHLSPDALKREEGDTTPPARHPATFQSASDEKKALAAGALLGVGAGAAAAAAAAETYSSTHAAHHALPHSPKSKNLAAAVGSPEDGGKLEPVPSRRYSAFPADIYSPSTPSGPSSTRAVWGSRPGTPGGTLGEAASSSSSYYATGVNGRATPDRRREESEDGRSGSPGPVVLSPHLKIATRKDSIGHNRLHKSSRDSSLPRSPAAGSPTPRSPVIGRHEEPEPTAGEEIWKKSVAHVVNSETQSRGHRPALVTIDSEDRSDYPVEQPTPPPISGSPHAHTHAQTHAHTRTRSKSTSTPPESPSTSATGHKLVRRRGSSARRSSVGEGDQAPRKEGFLHKVFGRGHERRTSGSGEAGERSSGEVGRGSGSGDERA